MRNLTGLIISILICVEAIGQNPYYLPLNRSNGLPSDIVFDIFQDSKGLMWLATNEGLFRYDGNYFQEFETNSQSSKSGTEIKEDRFGRVWYQNFDGHLFYIENDQMVRLEPREGQAQFHYGLLKDKLVIAYTNEIVVYSLKSLELIERINYQGDQTHITFCKGEAFYVVVKESDGCQEYVVDNSPGFKKHAVANDILNLGALIIDDNGDHITGLLKFGSKQSVFSYRGGKGKLETVFDIKFQRFFQNLKVIDGKYFLCSTGGLFVFSEDGVLEKGRPYFQGSSVSSIFKDKWGNFWVSTLHEGIFLVRDFESSLINVGSNKPNRVTSFNGELLVGMKNGELYTVENDHLGELVYKSENDHGIYFLDGLQSEESLFLTASGFTILDKNYRPTYPTTPSLKDIERVGDGVYATAISGFVGLLMMEEDTTNVWYKLFDKGRSAAAPVLSSTLACRGRSAAYSPQDSTIFFATNIGLYKCSPSELQPFKIDGSSIFAEQIEVVKRHLFIRNSEGEIICKRVDQVEDDLPLAKLEGRGWRKMKKFGETLVVMSDTRFVSLEMLGGNVIIKELLSKDPLDQINDYLLLNGVLYIASDNGVFIIKLEDLRPNSDPEFIFHHCKLNGKPLSLKELEDLDYGDNTIEINFSYLQFPGLTEGLLEYSLDGENWKSLQKNEGKIFIDHLASGNYHLMVRSGDEIFIDQRILISYPIWMRWWFIVLVILVVAFLIFAYFKNRTNVLLKQNVLLQEKVDLEKDLQTMMMKSIKSQMNPHFFYNALNTIQSFIFTDDKKNAGIYLSKFSKLTRLILEMSDQESVSLFEELNALRLYLDIEKVRFRDDFTFNIEIDENIDIDEVYLPSMLVQPYVENAIRHGLLHKRGQKIVFIGFYKKDDNLEIVVEDNGVGREKSKELNSLRNRGHQSFASAANSRRVEILNQMQGNPGVTFIDKRDSDGHPEGTVVKIIIPISYK